MHSVFSQVVHRAVTDAHFCDWLLTDPQAAAAAHGFVLNAEDQAVLVATLGSARRKAGAGSAIKPSASLAPWANGVAVALANS